MLVGLGLAGGSFTIVIAAFARLVSPDRALVGDGPRDRRGLDGPVPVRAARRRASSPPTAPATALLLLSGFVALVPILAVSLTGKGEEDPAEAHVGTREALRTAIRHPSYLLLTCGFFVCGFHIAFISTHLPPYLTDLGFSHSLAAWSLSLIGLFNVIGAYSAGMLGGQYPRRLLLSGIYLGRGIAFALFVLIPASTADRAACSRP